MIAYPKEFNQQLNVLLIEDDCFLRMALEDNLALLDCQVTACEDGQEAKDELFKNESEFDLILLDTSLPYIDGLELLKEIMMSQKFKEIPVIMMGQDCEKFNSSVFLIAGAQDVLMKPLKISQLKELRKYKKVKKIQYED